MRRRWTVAAVTALAALVVPATSQAACTSAQRADTAAAVALVAQLRAAAAPGLADATSVLDRARRRCTAGRFARAVASVTLRLGAATDGRRARVLGLDMIGTTSRGAQAWRLDTVRLAQRIASAPTPRAAAILRSQLLGVSSGAAALTFSNDATRADWSAQRQSAVLVALVRSDRVPERAIVGRGARAFQSPARLRGLAGLPLIDALRIANRVGVAAAWSGVPGAGAAARSVGLVTLRRVRAARVRGWSRVDGAWSSLVVHRALVAQSRALVRRVPHAASLAAVAGLERTLVTPARVDFGTLPVAAFYPWPRDSAFDTQSVGIAVDKPVTLRMSVYADDSRVVRTVDLASDPGTATITWDGTAADGSTLGAGDYRYNIDVTDLAGNRVRVPGLEQFRIARDTTPPTVRVATVRHVATATGRRLVATWEVAEVHSPQVRTWLIITQAGDRRSFSLGTSLQRASVRRVVDLPKGSWRANFVFLDGSGNRTSQPAGTFVVR